MHKITKHVANVYDGDCFDDLVELAADGHRVEILGGRVFVNQWFVGGYRFMIAGPRKIRRFFKETWSMEQITEHIAKENRDA